MQTYTYNAVTEGFCSTIKYWIIKNKSIVVKKYCRQSYSKVSFFLAYFGFKPLYCDVANITLLLGGISKLNEVKHFF